MNYNAAKRFLFPRRLGFWRIAAALLMFLTSATAFLLSYIWQYWTTVALLTNPPDATWDSVFGLLLIFSPFLLSWLLTGGGVLLLVLPKKPLSADGYEEIITARLADFEATAKTKFVFPENTVFRGPMLEFEDYCYRNTQASRVDGGIVRTDLYEKTALFLTETHLCLYSFRFRTFLPGQWEKTEILTYEELDSVTLTEENITLRKAPVRVKTVKITTTDGKTLEIPYFDPAAAQRDVGILRRISAEKKEGSR